MAAYQLWLIDAIHVRVNTTSPGGGVIGVLYNSTTAGEPAELLASTPAVTVGAGINGWLRMPLSSPHQVPAGTYWLGWLLEKDQGCFATAGTDLYSINAWPTPSAHWGTASAGPQGIDVFASVLPPLATVKSDDNELRLDGDQWRFELDDPTSAPSSGAGLEPGREWYRPEHPAPEDTIRVPGSWGSQGFGYRSAAYRHAWSGVGWYYTNVSFPAAWCILGHQLSETQWNSSSSSSMVLTIGGVMRRGRAWLDGVELGPEHIGYMDEWSIALDRALICNGSSLVSRQAFLSTQVVAVLPRLTKRLVVRVDNRANHSEGDCFSGCLDLRGMEAVLQVTDEHTPQGMEWGGKPRIVLRSPLQRRGNI
jgi:hypothetical protein